MSSSFGAFAVRGGYYQRAYDFIDYIVRQRPGTSALRLWLATSMDAAYGAWANSGITTPGLAAVLEAPVTKQGAIAQSDSIIRRGWNVAEVRRGHTSFQIDPTDFSLIDDQFAYFRVQEERGGVWAAVPPTAPLNANKPVLGPITVVPPTAFLSTPGMTLTFAGHAPLGTTCCNGETPDIDFTLQAPPPLYFALPRPATVFAVINLSATDDLLLSLGPALPMVTIPAGVRYCPTGEGAPSPTVTEFVVATVPTAATPVPFAVEAVLQIG